MSARRTDLLRLKAIVAHAEDLLDIVEHYRMSAEQYASPTSIDEEVRRAAVDFHMTQICEQAREMTDETREHIGGVPWRSVAEMRTYLVHAYDSLRSDQVWDTIVGGDLAELCNACEACIAEIEAGSYVPAFRSRTAERRATSHTA